MVWEYVEKLIFEVDKNFNVIDFLFNDEVLDCVIDFMNILVKVYN